MNEFIRKNAGIDAMSIAGLENFSKRENTGGAR